MIDFTTSIFYFSNHIYTPINLTPLSVLPHVQIKRKKNCVKEHHQNKCWSLSSYRNYYIINCAKLTSRLFTMHFSLTDFFFFTCQECRLIQWIVLCRQNVSLWLASWLDGICWSAEPCQLVAWASNQAVRPPRSSLTLIKQQQKNV